jgi:hypothetical protein
MWSIEDNPTNHLHLGRQLRRLVAHSCSCLSGKRTNSLCGHGTASGMGLCAPGVFRTTKKPEARQLDINRPDGQQPTASGTPAVPCTPAQAVLPCPRPPRVTRDTRVHVRDGICQGWHNPHPTPPGNFRAGFSPQLAAPLAGQVLQRQGRQGGVGRRRALARRRGARQGGQRGHASTLGLMTNPGETSDR